MPFITATALNKSYTVAANRLHVLRDLELSVERGEMVAIVGASGVGQEHALACARRARSSGVRGGAGR